MEFRRLEQSLLSHAKGRPTEIAIAFRRGANAQDVTWRQLLHRALQIAAEIRLRCDGGTPMGVFMEDKLDCHASVYGCFFANVPFVPIDPLWGDELICSMLAHAGVTHLVIADDSLLKRARRLAREGADVVNTSTITRQVGAFPSKPEGSPEDLALIAYTSGSTASPKAIPLRHKHLWVAYEAARTRLFKESPPRLFGAVMRLSGLGILGMNYLFAHQCGAGTVVLPEITISSAAGFWKACGENRVEFVYLVPALVNLLNKLARPERAESRLLCLSAAAPLSEEAQQFFQQKFQIPLRNGYGLTEASFMFTYGAVDESGFALPTIGRAESITAEIRDERNRALQGAARGQLWVAGPMVAGQYYQNETASQATFVDGGLLTGDIVERDALGFLKVVGRAKDVVLRGGFTIPLDEVESTLLAHPAVVDVCALGVNHAIIGEELYAAVCVRSTSRESEQSLLTWCRRRVGVQRAPRRIVFVNTLVRNGAGKLIRPANRPVILEAIATLEDAR